MDLSRVFGTWPGIAAAVSAARLSLYPATSTQTHPRQENETENTHA